MKLLPFWPRRSAKSPGLIDADGRIRDLSGARQRTSGGDRDLARGACRARRDRPRRAAARSRAPRYGLPVAGHAQVHRDRPQLSRITPPNRTCRAAAEPVIFTKASVAASRVRTTRSMIPRGSVKTDWEVELGVVIGKDARSYVNEAARARSCRRLLRRQRRVRARLSDGARRHLGQGQGLPRPSARSARGWSTADEVGDRAESWACGWTSMASASRTAPRATMIFRGRRSSSPMSAGSSRCSPATSSPPARRPGVGMGQKPEPWYT